MSGSCSSSLEWRWCWMWMYSKAGNATTGPTKSHASRPNSPFTHRMELIA
ncbi:Uncharacterised protein [Mycobacterium tuberculosis]|uniref:Uncharacterized protein n=1 Tax=Mycobacterium tuberculosis TaxID=1773 RepID=A0A655JEF8_MYCTX|nr:Uncharacterised protein [Mycobacterium tuberculosis]